MSQDQLADPSLSEAFAAAMDAAPGWLFLSLAQDVTPILNAGDVHTPTGVWTCKLQLPTGGRLRIGQGDTPARAILTAAHQARADQLSWEAAA